MQKDERLWTTSRDVAEKFKKQHKDVLRAYETVKANCSGEFSERNFALASYENAQRKNRPMLKMTRGGFLMLVMGFTGKKA